MITTRLPACEQFRKRILRYSHIVTPHKASRTTVPQSFLPKLLLPFAVPILATMVLVVVVGDDWPRNIPPGSGLKLAGFVASAVTALIVWRFATRSIADRRARVFAALVCGVVGLMGWPVWSIGVLPSVNGAILAPAQSVQMRLERTQTTTVSRSRRLNHWAWLRPLPPAPAAEGGRYFIPEETYARWNRDQPDMVTVTRARGLLGAQVVTGYE